MIGQRARTIWGRIVCALAVLVAIMGGGAVWAQDSFRAMPVLPLGAGGVYDAAPYAVLMPATGATATYDGFLAALSSSQNDIRLDQTRIQTGGQAGPYWIALALRNTGTVSDWALDFGTLTQGRAALIKGIFIFDHRARQMVVDSFPKEDGTIPHPLPIGPVVPIGFERGQERFLIAYVVPHAGQPFSHPLTIRSVDAVLGGTGGVMDGALAVFALLAAGVALSIVMQGMWAQGVGTVLFFGGAFAVQATIDRALVGGTLEWIMAVGGRAGMAAGLLLLAVGLGGSLRTNTRQLTALGAGVITLAAALSVLLGAGQAGSILPTLAMGAMILTGPLAAAFIWATRAQRGHRPSDHIISALFTLGVLAALAESAAPLIGMPMLSSVALIGAVLGIGAGLGVFLLVRQSRVADRLAHHRTLSAERLEALNALKGAKDSSDYTNLLKVIEHERKLLIAAREREAQRIEEMRLAKVAADDANAAKSAFLAVISHEIRTPMTGVMGMVRLLQDTALNGEQVEYTRTIQESGNAMMALLNDILDFEKIESGRLQLENVTFDIRRLLQGILNLMQGQATQKNISLRMEIEDSVPTYLQGDPARLRQVLLNLVGNAIKFTHKGGVIVHLRISPSDQSGARGETIHDVYFAVQDTGIGIARGAERNIFTPFAQADASISRKFGGTGLGLAICKRLIEAMGSTINISSKEGEGTTFFFSLRMAEGHAEAGTLVDTGSTGGAGRETGANTNATHTMRLLIVDDNEINRRVIAGLVDRKGHLTALAESAEEAIEKIKQTPFDGIFMDIQLNGMNGLDATREIRQLSDLRAATTPIVALTGNVTDEDIKACFEAGMNDFIAKPINTDQFDQVLVRLQTGDFAHAIKGMGPREPALTPQEREILTVSERPLRALRADSPAVPPVPSAPLAQTQTQQGDADKAPVADLSAPAPLAASPLQIDEDDAALPAVLRYAKQLEQAAASPGAASATMATPSGMENASLNDDAFDDPFALEGEDETQDTGAAPSDSQPPVFDEQMVGTLKSALSAKDLEELVNGFLAKSEEILETLNTAIGHGLMDTVRDKAHEMKGMAGNFGMLGVSRTAGIIEKQLRGSDSGTLDRHALAGVIAQLRGEYETARTAIQEWMKR